MARTPVLLSTPIEFTDVNGALVQIPGSVLFFEDGTVQVDSSWTAYAPNATTVDALLEALEQAGLVLPAPVPPAEPAFVVTAKDPGIFGNDIELFFTDVHPDPADPTKTRLTATLTERHVFTGLTPNGPEPKLKTVLGTSVNTGAGRTLAFVASSGTPTLPPNGEFTFTGTGTGGIGPFQAAIKSGPTATPAFTLESRRDDSAAKATTAIVTNVSPSGGTFDLELVWTKTVTNVEPSSLDTEFGYEIDITPPEGQTEIKPPAPGTVVLSGGANATSAKPAKATVVTGR
jgi:hypothetical protein